MPRILFCSESAHAWGGIAKWLDHLIPRLGSAGWDVVVGLTKGWHHHDPERYRSAHPEMETVAIQADAPTPSSRIRAVRRTIQKLNPDIVVPVTAIDPFWAACSLKSDGCAFRLLVTYRDYVPSAIVDHRENAGCIDAGVGVNLLLSELLSAYVGIPKERAYVVPSIYARREHRVCRASKDGSEPLRLGYIGRLENYQKRVGDAVELIRLLDAKGVRYHFSFVGSGPYEDALKETLAAHSVAGTVAFLGYRPNREVVEEIIPTLDCLLLFSMTEGSPNVLWEAMDGGVVPILSRYMGCTFDRVVAEGETGFLFEVGDVKGAAHAVEALAASPELLRRVSEAAKSAEKKGLSADQMAAKWKTIFSEVLARPLRNGNGAVRIPGYEPRLERMGMPSAAAHRLRCMLGRWPHPQVPSDEWPNGYGGSEEVKKLDALAREIDRGVSRMCCE